MKKLILFLMFVMLSTIAYANIQCDISEDNITWTNINSTLIGGCVNGDLASVQNLQADTEYCIRCRNDSSYYGYECFTTKHGGLDEQMLALILGFIATIAFLLVLAYKIESKWIQIFLYMISLFQVLMMVGILYTAERGSEILGLVRTNFWIVLLISMLIVLTAIVSGLIKLGNPDPDEELDAELKWQGR